MKNAAHDRGRRLLHLLILVCLASCASNVSAGVGVWTTNGPYGVEITALAVSPSNSATLYAGTSGSGVFKSTDSGSTWAAANTGLASLYVYALAVNPAAPTTLYAAGSGGVFKSTDSGGTWAAANAGLTNLYVYTLAVNPLTPSTLYAGTFGGVFKSTDSGGTWAAANVGLSSPYVYALAVNPAAPATLYAGTIGPQVFKSTDAGGSWAATGSGPNDPWGYGDASALAVDPSSPATLYVTTTSGVFKSTDGGGSWTASGTGLTANDPLALAIDPANPTTIYVGTRDAGVFKSTNGGETWSAVNSGLASTKVQALAIDPSAPATLYAGTSGEGVFKRANGIAGAIWLLPSSAHLSGASGAFYTTNVAVANVGAAPATLTMKFLGHDQDGSGGPEQTFNLEAGKSVTYFDVLDSVFHETSAFGAIRITSDTTSLRVVSMTSTPGFGGTLSQTVPAVSSSDLIPAGSSLSILYLREGDGFRSNLVLASNAGVATTVNAALVSPEGATLATKSYSVPPNGMTQINRVVRDMGVSGSITGARLVLSSSTSGAAFAAFASVIDEVTNDPTAITASLSTTVRAGQGVWTSGGPDSGSPVSTVAVDPRTSSTLYAATVNAIYKSTDSGRTWAFSPASSVFYVYYSALAINPSTPSTLYAGSEEFGVQKSTDGGGTWATTGLAGGVRALAIDPATPSTVYAGGDPGGVFKSTDSGVTWTAANAGLTSLGTYALAVNPSTPTTLYAGTGGGVFKSTDSGVTWTAANAGLTSLGINALAVNLSTPTTLYAGTGDGVFKSTDAGETWALASAGLPNPSPGSPNRRVHALVINPTAPDTLYAGTDGAGVFRSRDGGGTWVAISAGLPSIKLFGQDPPRIFVSSLAMDPTGATTLYAGLSVGVWQLTAPSSGPSPTTFLLPASAHAPGANGAFYTTNVAVANVGAAPASFTMKFFGHDQDGSGGPEQTFNLEAGKSVTYFDVLGSVFRETSAFGAIHIASDTPSLRVVSVTSTPGFGGTLSQVVPAVSSSDLIPAGPQRSILYIREGDGFRSNLVLASDAGVFTTVVATLMSPSGETLAIKSYSVPPSGMTQINRVVRDMGVAGPVTGARLVLSSSTPGAAFTAFASVIDETTNDPTAVEAK